MFKRNLYTVQQCFVVDTHYSATDTVLWNSMEIIFCLFYSFMLFHSSCLWLCWFFYITKMKIFEEKYICMKFCFKLDKLFSETLKMLQEVYEEGIYECIYELYETIRLVSGFRIRANRTKHPFNTMQIWLMTTDDDKNVLTCKWSVDTHESTHKNRNF